MLIQKKDSDYLLGDLKFKAFIYGGLYKPRDGLMLGRRAAKRKKEENFSNIKGDYLLLRLQIEEEGSKRGRS